MFLFAEEIKTIIYNILNIKLNLQSCFAGEAALTIMLFLYEQEIYIISILSCIYQSNLNESIQELISNNSYPLLNLTFALPNKQCRS